MYDCLARFVAVFNTYTVVQLDQDYICASNNEHPHLNQRCTTINNTFQNYALKLTHTSH